jgi:putative transposase
MRVRRSNHAVYTINYHFVWCPKYRNAVLDRIEPSLEQSIRGVAERYGYDILSLHISADHVHLFLSAHPKHAPSEIVRTIKSITAREMWERHESLLEREFWSGGFWERSFYVGTTGEMSSRTVERYINRTEHV